MAHPSAFSLPPRWRYWPALLLSGTAYGLLAYATPRAHFGQLLGLLAGAFGAYAWLLRAGLPVQPPTLLSAVRSALRARVRQYQVRDYLAERAQAEENTRRMQRLDAVGKLVTPGFVDIHTHYDAQVTWDTHFSPSTNHGVTTVLLGNCGVGFAPCRPEQREAMIRSMVERLAARLETNPDDRDGWLRLARAYEVLGEAEKAEQARGRAEALAR